MRKGVLLLFAAALALTPATAQRLAISIRATLPRRSATMPQIIEELGGAEPGPRAAYVESVGRRVAAYSGIASPGQALHFTTLNSAVENAFSVPGGYVYITRQLMTLMGNESQLAFALGHEVGHIAGNHAHQREAAEREHSVAALPEIMLGADVRRRLRQASRRQSGSRPSSTRSSFSREQEYEADTLGLRYMIAAGYDPAGAAAVACCAQPRNGASRRASRAARTGKSRNGRAPTR